MNYVNIGNAIGSVLQDGVQINYESMIPFQAGLMASGMLLLEVWPPLPAKNMAAAFTLIATEAGAAGTGEEQTLSLVTDTCCVRC